MADARMNSPHLPYLKDRARELSSACQALNTFLANGADLMAWEADARRLEATYTALLKNLDEVASHEKREEVAATEGDAIALSGVLIVKAVGSVMGKHAQVVAFDKALKARRAGRRWCFGTIMVHIGAGGLPDDVTIVPISRLARTQNREEYEIIREFQQRSGLLFSPETFCLMLGTLIENVRTGKLRLPILPKQLPAKLAILREVTVEFPVSVQPVATGPYQAMVVPQLPPGKDISTTAKGNSPNDTV